MQEAAKNAESEAGRLLWLRAWGHTAGAASNPADAKFLNDNIRKFLASGN